MYVCDTNYLLVSSNASVNENGDDGDDRYMLEVTKTGIPTISISIADKELETGHFEMTTGQEVPLRKFLHN